MSSAASKRRTIFGVVLRVAVTAGVFAFLFSRIDVRAVAQSVRDIPPTAAVTSVVSLIMALVVGVERWRMLLRAAGASRIPNRRDALRMYWVGMFYNLLPGAVGGDVYRGYASRHCFGEGAATRSVGVVFVERVCGFSGMLVLAAMATLATPNRNPLVLAYSGAGLLAALGAIVVLAIGRRFSALLPARIGKITASLPVIPPSALAIALAFSVVCHVAVGMTGYPVLVSLAPQVSFAQGMAAFPLGTLASFFPLTVAGAGARDGALVFVLAQIGVAREHALATSLSMLATNLVVSSIGGFLQSDSGKMSLPSADAKL
jgi:glycosyltransferase 2 family protein